VAETCPAYRTHLRIARACLARGTAWHLDRAATAQEALASCLRRRREVALASPSCGRPLGSPILPSVVLGILQGAVQFRRIDVAA